MERVIGTLMEMMHELPGTTFSNIQERGQYDSEKLAVLTLAELERWLALAVCVYHGRVQGTLGQTPAGQWAHAAAVDGVPALVTSETAFLVDFLPVFRRTLTRAGFALDHVQYFRNALKPLIARRERLGQLVLRRDPRDLSRIWALDPDSSTYIEVPYRNLSHPPISWWEHKAAVKRLRELGRTQVDEDALFRMVEQMHTITEEAAKTTRKARRDIQRRPAIAVPAVPPPAVAPPPDQESAAAPFAVIEEW